MDPLLETLLPHTRDGSAKRTLESSGLPGKKDEAWRFTPLQKLKASTPSYEAWTPEHEAGEETPKTSREPAFFSALTEALSDAKCFLLSEATPKGQVTQEFVYTGKSGVATAPNRRFVVTERSEVVLVEHFVGDSGLTSAVSAIDVQDGARLTHILIHEDAGNVVSDVHVQVGRAASYESHVVTFGGALMRLSLEVDLVKEGAQCALFGAYHVDGEDVVDHHLSVRHSAPNASSKQEYRGLADGRGTAIFDGQALVLGTGGGAEAHQSNQNLLLSDRATVHTKPHLEIDHDDVVASHGATVGALDEDSVFYLRSRGVSEQEARAMLTFAFVSSILDGVPVSELSAELHHKLASRIAGGESLGEGGDTLTPELIGEHFPSND